VIDRRTLIAVAPLALAPRSARCEDSALSALERAIGGRIGLYARNVDTGAQIAWRAEARFAMCSTFKAALAGAVLARVDRGEERLDRVIPYGQADLLDYAPITRAHVARGGLPVADLCQAAVELSDNTAANLLLAEVGGPAGLTAFLRATGDEATRLDRTEPALNSALPGDQRDTTTPRAMAHTLQRLLLGPALSPASRALLTGWMLDCKTGDKRLRAGLPGTWRVADKTGNNGHGAAGDIAVAWPRPGAPILICSYVIGAAAPPAVDAAFATIGTLIARRLAT